MKILNHRNKNDLVLISNPPDSSKLMGEQIDRILESSDPSCSQRFSLFKNRKIDYSNNSIHFRSMHLPTQEFENDLQKLHSLNQKGVSQNIYNFY